MWIFLCKNKGHRSTSSANINDAEHGCFLSYQTEAVEHTVEMPVVWGAVAFMWRYFGVSHCPFNLGDQWLSKECKVQAQSKSKSFNLGALWHTMTYTLCENVI